MLTKMVLRITPKNEGQTEASVVHWAELLPALFKEYFFTSINQRSHGKIFCP